METKISDLLPKSEGTANTPLSEILTEQEKAQVIHHAKQILITAYTRRATGFGISERKILQRVKEKDWEAQMNIPEILAGANQRKHWQEETEQARRDRKQKEADRLAELHKKCDARYFFDRIRAFFIHKHGRFIYDANKEYIKSICLFMAGDARFETELGYSFKKGLMIMGTAGLGKTDVIMAVADNGIRPIKVFGMIDITERVKTTGECLLNTATTILLDDVGTEQETVKYYGTEIHWFKEFIETYYLHAGGYYAGLIITTNLDGKQIEEMYGYRVRSRMREMFNVITVKGEDLRK